MLAATTGVAGAQVVDASDNNAPVGSGNQVPLAACNNQVPVNALGVQVPVQEIEAALGLDLLSSDDDDSGEQDGDDSGEQDGGGSVVQDESCDSSLEQESDVGDGDNADDRGDDEDSVVRADGNNVPALSNNQVPAEACNNQVPVNALGVQVPVQEIQAALGLDLLSSDTDDSVEQDESCDPSMEQESDVGDGTTPAEEGEGEGGGQ